MAIRHMHTAKILAVALIAALMLAACSNTNKIGSVVKGTRVAVMEDQKTVSTDKDLAGQRPQLSDTTLNVNWPQSGYDTAHMMPNANLSDHPSEIWTASIGEGSDSDFKLLARPVIENGRVYTMDAQGLVSAFNVRNGDKMWEFDTTPKDREENAIGGGIGVDGDTLYATTGFGEVLALRANDGSVLWRKALTNPLRAAPTIAEGRVYVVSIDNQLDALDARTGDNLWHHNGIAESATLMGAANPAVVDDNIVVAYSSGEIFNLRTENGKAAWDYALTTPTQVGALPAIADIRGLPVIDHGRVFAIGHSGRMAAIDQRSGERVWENDVGGINTPVVSGDAVFVLSNDGQLVAMTRDSGRVMWMHELQKQEDPEDHDSDPVYWTGPVLAGGKLWLTNSMGQLAAFSAADGSDLGSTDLDGPSFITPVIADGTIYVVTDNGTLIALK